MGEPDQTLISEVAALVDPVAFGQKPEHYGTDEEGFKLTLAWGKQQVARIRARDIIKHIQGMRSHLSEGAAKVIRIACAACAGAPPHEAKFCRECRGVGYFERVQSPSNCTGQQPECPVYSDPMSGGWECRHCGRSGPAGRAALQKEEDGRG